MKKRKWPGKKLTSEMYVPPVMTLLAGGVIQEPIREDLTYDIAHSAEDNLWNILYLTGYLT